MPRETILTADDSGDERPGPAPAPESLGPAPPATETTTAEDIALRPKRIRDIIGLGQLVHPLVDGDVCLAADLTGRGLADAKHGGERVSDVLTARKVNS